MLRLFIMRHGKSSWAVPGARDIDRELNDKGRSDLSAIAAELRSKSMRPEMILCSTATRTRQTLECINEAWDTEPQVQYIERLYSGHVDDYVEFLRTLGEIPSAMTVGHNPMSGTLANLMAGSGDEAARTVMAQKYPTSGVAVIDFEISNWSELRTGEGHLVDFLYPSKLKSVN